MKKALYLLLITVTLIFLVLLAGPGSIRPKVSREIQGTVTTVYNYGNKDLIVKIGETRASFCISKILDKTHEISDYRSKLLGKKVTIQYSDSWTPLDPGCTKQVSELKVEETLLYSLVPR